MRLLPPLSVFPFVVFKDMTNLPCTVPSREKLKHAPKLDSQSSPVDLKIIPWSCKSHYHMYLTVLLLGILVAITSCYLLWAAQPLL